MASHTIPVTSRTQRLKVTVVSCSLQSPRVPSSENLLLSFLCGWDRMWNFYWIQWILDLGGSDSHGAEQIHTQDIARLFLDLRSVLNWLRVNCDKINNCNRITHSSPREAARHQERAGSFPVSAFPLPQVPSLKPPPLHHVQIPLHRLLLLQMTLSNYFFHLFINSKITCLMCPRFQGNVSK